MSCGGCGGNVHQVTARLEPDPDAPLMFPDGTVLFYSEAPEVDGYTKDPEDPRKLIPNKPVACGYRISGILLNRDGSYTPTHICRHSDCEHLYKEITFDICSECPLKTL